MVAHLFLAPPVPHTKEETAVRDVVQAGHLFRQPDRVALRHQGDSRSELQVRGDRRAGRERHELIDRAPVLLRERRGVLHPAPGRLAAGRDVAVLGKPQRLETALFRCFRQRDRLNRFVGGEDHDADVHGRTPFESWGSAGR